MPSFEELDMSDVEVRDGGPVLKAGVYLLEITAAELKKAKNGSSQFVEVTFDDTAGNGQITERFNVFNSSPEARRIGREQFKTMLTHAGHPNPSAPGNIQSLIGLRLKGRVIRDGTYTTKDGEVRDSFGVKRYFGLENPVEVGIDPEPAGQTASGVGRATGGSGVSGLNDEIPF